MSPVGKAKENLICLLVRYSYNDTTMSSHVINAKLDILHCAQATIVFSYGFPINKNIPQQAANQRVTWHSGRTGYLEEYWSHNSSIWARAWQTRHPEPQGNRRLLQALTELERATQHACAAWSEDRGRSVQMEGSLWSRKAYVSLRWHFRRGLHLCVSLGWDWSGLSTVNETRQ